MQDRPDWALYLQNHHMQTLGSPMQVKPISIRQTLEQPSMSVVFMSSHASPPRMRPSPQIAVQEPAP